MNRIAPIILLTLIFLSLDGVSQDWQHWRGKAGQVSYLEYQASGNPKKLIVYPMYADSAVIETFNELKHVANAFNARLIIAKLDSSMNENTFMDFAENSILEKYTDSNKTMIFNGPISQLAGARSLGTFNALILNPSNDTTAINFTLDREVAAYVIQTNLDADCELYTNRLEKGGVWLIEKSINDSEISIINNSETMIKAIRQLDSMQSILVDSNQFSVLVSEAGLQSSIQEIYRQGQKIPLKIEISQQGSVEVRVSTLSSKVVQEIEEYLGKGSHEIVLKTDDLEWGVYLLDIIGEGIREQHKFMIRG